MKTWKFKSKSSPEEISKKLAGELKSIGGFVLDMNLRNNKSVTFKVRKRMLYAWYLAFQNWTVVKGKLLKDDSENRTQVEISFNKHFFIKMIIFTHIIFGLGFLIAIISGKHVNTADYVIVGTLLVLGIVLWIAIQRKFERDIQKYKLLISDIFEV